MWDTENGPGEGDEINLVEAGFNSGWALVQGISTSTSNNNIQDYNPSDLVDFDGKGTYSDPDLNGGKLLVPLHSYFCILTD